MLSSHFTVLVLVSKLLFHNLTHDGAILGVVLQEGMDKVREKLFPSLDEEPQQYSLFVNHVGLVMARQVGVLNLLVACSIYKS